MNLPVIRTAITPLEKTAGKPTWSHRRQTLRLRVPLSTLSLVCPLHRLLLGGWYCYERYPLDLLNQWVNKNSRSHLWVAPVVIVILLIVVRVNWFRPDIHCAFENLSFPVGPVLDSIQFVKRKEFGGDGIYFADSLLPRIMPRPRQVFAAVLGAKHYALPR